MPCDTMVDGKKASADAKDDALGFFERACKARDAEACFRLVVLGNETPPRVSAAHHPGSPLPSSGAAQYSCLCPRASNEAQSCSASTRA